MRRFYTHLPERRLIAHQQNTLHCFEGLRAIRQRFRSADVPARVDAGCTGEHVEGSCYALKAKWQACPEGSDGVARMVQEQRAGKPMGLRSLSSLVYSSSHKDWSCWQGCPRHRKQTPCAPSLRVLRVSVCIRPAHAEARRWGASGSGRLARHGRPDQGSMYLRTAIIRYPEQAVGLMEIGK